MTAHARSTLAAAFLLFLVCGTAVAAENTRPGAMGPPATADKKFAAAELVSAEREFAAAAEAHGTQAAFLEYLAPQGVLYRPGPVDGRKWMKEQLPLAGLLKWEPAFAEVSGAGDMGITTGPWSFSPATEPNGPPGGPAAWGEFVSVWTKQADGSWKVILDAGISHGKHQTDKPGLRMRKPNFDVMPRTTAAAQAEAKGALGAADDSYLPSVASWKKRQPGTLVLAEKVRMLREGKMPILNAEEVKAALAATPDPGRCTRDRAVISAGAELGFTMGTCAAATKIVKPSKDAPKAAGKTVAGEQFSYLRVWRWWGYADAAAKRWELVFDVVIPLPAEESGALAKR